MKDTSVAIELYKHSVSTLHTLELASKEEQRDYVGAWYRMLLPSAHELQHGAALWQESCHANVCDQVISEGTNICHDQQRFYIRFWMIILSSHLVVNYKLSAMLALQVVTTLLLLGRYIELHRFYIYPCSVSSPGFLQILEC